MNKTTVVVSCPVDTYSGYGARARDFVKALVDIGKYDVKVLSQRWGNTRTGYLEDHNESILASLIIPSLTEQPDVWVQITVPNEFQKIGKYNIGLTAGMETTLVHGSWIQGCNRMDLVLTSSQHSKNVFLGSKFDMEDPRTKQSTPLELTTPIEVLLEGADLTKYFRTTSKANIKLNLDLDNIKESFCFLFVGHWLSGDAGEDRKNISFMIKAFTETFKNKPAPPALILKTQSATTSIMDRERMLDRIEGIKNTCKGSLPTIYLLHGEISDMEMNELYNHPKVKSMISFTKGEGFGRPLLEFTLTGKPVIASGWSGQLDFLQPEFSVLIGGELTNVHPSAAAKDMILTESKWFSPDGVQVGKALKEMHKNYKNFVVRGKQQGNVNKKNFSYQKMVEVLQDTLDRNLPNFPKQIELNLPTLTLPKLQ